MIIFDLDGTLADCEHRRHFVDPSKRDDCVLWLSGTTKEQWVYHDGCQNHETRKKFKPDWKSFYEACDKDEPIEPTLKVLGHLLSNGENVEIWSGRCESVRDKTENWLKKYTSFGGMNCRVLKMRPIGDSTPDDELKEMWFHDAVILEGKTIDFVFDSCPKSISMWRRRGIFVFNCCQHDEEF